MQQQDKKIYEAIHANLDINEACERLGIKRSTSNKNNYVCPFCGSGTGANKTAAFFTFTGTDGKQRYKCQSAGCGASGDVIELIEKVKGISKAEAIQTAKTWSNIQNNKPLPVQSNKQETVNAELLATNKALSRAYIKEAQKHITDSEAINYLESRGLDLESAKAAGWGYVPKGTNTGKKSFWNERILIPFKEPNGYYYTARDITGKSNVKYQKPYTNEVGPQPIQNAAAINQEYITICEGAIDAFALEAAGVKGVIATCGAARESIVNYLTARSYKGNVLVLPDNDEAGHKQATLLVDELNRAQIKACILNLAYEIGEKDAADVYETNPIRLLTSVDNCINQLENERVEQEREELQKQVSAGRLLDAAAIADSIFYDNDLVEPIKTGITELDKAIGGGLYPGVYGIGAPSNLGKTTFSLQVADNIAAGGTPALYITIEQSSKELVSKSLSRLMYEENAYKTVKTEKGYYDAPISSRDITTKSTRISWNDAIQAKFQIALSKYNDTIAPNLKIVEATRKPKVEDIKLFAQYVGNLYGMMPVIFLDYLQLIGSEDTHATDKMIIDDAMMKLRQLARDLNTPIWVISSLNRSSYSGSIQVSSFKESGSIEYSSDVVLALQYYGIRDIENRRNGGTSNQDRWLMGQWVSRERSRRYTRVELHVLKNRWAEIPDPKDPLIMKFNGEAASFEPVEVQPFNKEYIEFMEYQEEIGSPVDDITKRNKSKKAKDSPTKYEPKE